MSRRTFWDEPRPTVFRCTECGERVPNAENVALDGHCLKCGADLHSCRNCAYFDTSLENECRETVPERFPKKRANNTCTLFRPVLQVDLQGSEKEAPKSDDARKAWDALFK